MKIEIWIIESKYKLQNIKIKDASPIILTEYLKSKLGGVSYAHTLFLIVIISIDLWIILTNLPGGWHSHLQKYNASKPTNRQRGYSFAKIGHTSVTLTVKEAPVWTSHPATPCSTRSGSRSAANTCRTCAMTRAITSRRSTRSNTWTRGSSPRRTGATRSLTSPAARSEREKHLI